MNEDQIIAAQEALITQLQEEVRRKDAEIAMLRAQVARPQPSWPWPSAPPHEPWNQPPIWCGGYVTTPVVRYPQELNPRA
jgi:hypothetical protein